MKHTRTQTNRLIEFSSTFDLHKDKKVISGIALTYKYLIFIPLIFSTLCCIVHLYLFSDYLTSDFLNRLANDQKMQMRIMLTFFAYHFAFMMINLISYVFIPTILTSKLYGTHFFFQENELHLRYSGVAVDRINKAIDYYDIKYIQDKTLDVSKRKKMSLFNYYAKSYLSSGKTSGIIEVHLRNKEVIECCYMEIILSDENKQLLFDECRKRQIKVAF